MSFEQLIAILRARWLIAMATFVLIMGAVTAYTLLTPKSYTAFSTVLVDVKPDPILGAVLNGGGSASYMQTQVDIIASRRVAQLAAKIMELHKQPQLRSQWLEATGGKGDFDAWAADLIRSGVQAQPSRGSNIISVTYTAADPGFAAALTNAFVQAYLDMTMELRASPAKQYNTFFNANAKQLKEQLEAAQAKLSGFQNSEGLLATDERVDIESERLNQLSSQLVMLQAAAADSSSRRIAAVAQGARSPDVMSNPMVAGLTSEVGRAETQLAQLSIRLGTEHPSVLELKTSIADMRTKLDAEIRNATGMVGVGNSVNIAKIASTQADLNDQRARVLKLKSVRDQAAILQQEVNNAQRAYEGVVTRMNTSTLESQSVPLSVSVLEPAAPPVIPSAPRVKTNIGFGVVIALVMAVGLALLVEHFNRKLRTSAEAESLLAQPVIAVIPSFRKIKASIEVPSRLQFKPTLLLKAASK
jgi:succinoglycan biosynthesis transport protein ExoP